MMEITKVCADLMLAKQTYSLETVWMEGYAHGISESHNKIRNPYPRNSHESSYWQEGWDSGFYDEDALYPDYTVELEAIPEVVAENGRDNGKFNLFDKCLYSFGFAVSAVAVYAVMAA